MASDEGSAGRGSSDWRAARFATTHWSLVAAASDSNPDDARAALESLCRSYWYPLYVFVRRQGRGADEAQDLTQSFFLELLSKERLQRAREERGRFRSFLLTALRNFLANERRDARAAKRGGDRIIEPLEVARGEERYSREPEDGATPERIFERHWAWTLTQTALGALEAEYQSAGKHELFVRLVPYLHGEREQGYAELAAELGLSEGAIKTAVHRLRGRCRECLRAEIARTVMSEAEIDDEMRDLFSALG